MFMMVDYVKEMTVKRSCNYGNYGWFEHLLFLFSKTTLLVYSGWFEHLLFLFSKTALLVF